VRHALTLLTALIALTSCSDGDPSNEPDALNLPLTSAAESSPELNDRGNMPKYIGEEAHVLASTAADAAWVLTFNIDEIRVDPACDSGFPEPPANGHYIAISVRVATTPDYDPDTQYLGFTENDFRVIQPDGITVSDVTGKARSCLDPSHSIASAQIGPGQQYAGTVVIDAPVSTGALVYAPGGAPAGWEWDFF